MHETLGTRLEFSTSFHPQKDGQTERVNQILEDMLRACAQDYGSSWDDNLPYAEFSYNNSYQTSLKMALSKSETEFIFVCPHFEELSALELKGS